MAMLDTIVIRIHNVEKYKFIHEQTKLDAGKKSQMVVGYMAVDSDGVVEEGARTFRRGALFTSAGKFLPITTRFDINAPSHNYKCRVSVRHSDGVGSFLELELSVPKFYYGTNVFQYLPLLPHGIQDNFNHLIRAVRGVIKGFFIQMPSFEDIQIFRIDLCYNQFFSNKADALNYQCAQREHMRAYCMARGQKMFPHDVGAYDWSVVTDRYSFKCYHKGTEFQKHDLKVLEKNRKCPYHLGHLSGIADRILRYEITFRDSMLSYLLLYHTFDSIEPSSRFLKQTNLYRYVTRLDKFGFMDAEFDRRGAGTSSGAIGFFCSKRKDFFLRSAFDGLYNERLVAESRVTFDVNVYKLIFTFFWSKVKDSQVNRVSGINEVKKLLDKYQGRLSLKKRARVTKRGSMTQKGSFHTARLLVPALLAQYVDLRLLRRELPEATYKRLISDLRAAGVPMKVEGVAPPPALLDYSDNLAVCVPMIRKFLYV